MNVGKTLFAQVMEFVPWKTFGRIIERHKGDAGVRTLDCADLFRIMAFAQLTWRESLRDIEVCLTSDQAKLFHMGLKAPPARSTLADALNQRDWRIYHALAQRQQVQHFGGQPPGHAHGRDVGGGLDGHRHGPELSHPPHRAMRHGPTV